MTASGSTVTIVLGTPSGTVNDNTTPTTTILWTLKGAGNRIRLAAGR